MTINEVAKKLLELRETRMTGYIMSGVLREELGFDGYATALNQRWIEADMEQSGMVTITNHLTKVAEMRQLAAECKAKCGTCGKASCGCEGRCDSCNGEKCTCESVQPIKESETAHFFAQAHAFRRNVVSEVVGNPPVCSWCKKKPSFPPSRYCQDCEARHQADNDPDPLGQEKGQGIYTYRQESSTLGLGRTGDAPDVPVPGLGAQSAAPATTQRTAPQAQSSGPAPRPQPVGIGQDVVVVEGGKQYVGKVSKTLPDGKYEISFAGEQPPVRRAYDKTEVSTSAPGAVK